MILPNHGAARRTALHACAVVASAVAIACGERPAQRTPTADSAAESPRSAGVVDSIIPIAEALRRFRADLGPAPDRLDGDGSRDALVRRFVRAVERADTAAFRSMALSRREFAYLYYPESPLSRRPYEEPPALLWFRVSEGSNTGIARVLRRYGGRPLGYVSYGCEATPEAEGANSLWERCRVRRVRAAGDTVEERLFGSIVERDGRFKFVGYANDF